MVGCLSMLTVAGCCGPSSVVVVGIVLAIAVEPLAYGSSINVLGMGGCAC